MFEHPIKARRLFASRHPAKELARTTNEAYGVTTLGSVEELKTRTSAVYHPEVITAETATGLLTEQPIPPALLTVLGLCIRVVDP